jgi:hypothetical protein
LVHFMAIWYSLCSFGIVFPFLACLYQETFGNPAYLQRWSRVGRICGLSSSSYFTLTSA